MDECTWKMVHIKCRARLSATGVYSSSSNLFPASTGGVTVTSVDKKQRVDSIATMHGEWVGVGEGGKDLLQSAWSEACARLTTTTTRQTFYELFLVASR